jgi:CheY-like chemotaxis protein
VARMRAEDELNPEREGPEDVRILVVDDFADAAEPLAELLVDNGYSVRVAPGGEEALLMVPDFHPHCVILDINMPGVNGLQLTQRLKAAYGDDIVLIAVTGGAKDDRVVAETFARVDHYLPKPIDIERLERILPPLALSPRSQRKR